MTKKKKIYDTLVDRDKKVIDLLELVKVATREQIQRVVYSNVSENIPMRKLTMLYENKLIKRDYYQLEKHKNVYVYYLDNKPSKRNIHHEILVTEFITKVITITEVLDIKTHYILGDIISDAYIKYKDSEGRIRRLLLEVQRSGKTKDCTNKYNKIKDVILDERKDWKSMPRLIVITDLDHNNEQLKNIKIKYDNTQMKNLRKILF